MFVAFRNHRLRLATPALAVTASAAAASKRLVEKMTFLRMMATFLALLVSLAFPSQTLSASFDCGAAQSYAEKMVCQVPELSALDEMMAHNYTVMRAADLGDGATEHLVQTQRDWLSLRDQCNDVDCLLDQYLLRIEEICMYPVISGMYPDCREPY